MGIMHLEAATVTMVVKPIMLQLNSRSFFLGFVANKGGWIIRWMMLTFLCPCPLVVILSVVDYVTQQETSDVFFWDGRPLQHH